MARTKDALKILETVTGENSTVRQGIANARIHLEVAGMIYDARTKAGLSQRELAELIGSKQSAIARLEDADYYGHSLSYAATDRGCAGPALGNAFRACEPAGFKAGETGIGIHAITPPGLSARHYG